MCFYFTIICNICDLAFIIYIIVFKPLVEIHFDEAVWNFFQVDHLWEDCVFRISIPKKYLLRIEYFKKKITLVRGKEKVRGEFTDEGIRKVTQASYCRWRLRDGMWLVEVSDPFLHYFHYARLPGKLSNHHQ